MQKASAYSIHSVQAISFMRDVIGADTKVLSILKQGLILQFEHLPGPYNESNNKSAVDNIDFVRKKVTDWEAAGYVSRLTGPAYCCNPLSVAEKYDVLEDKLKLRLVLDMSRHVNLCIKSQHVKIDDLTVAEQLIEKGDFMQAFDLKNQFFHVQLHESMKKFFGFAVPEADGTVSYYYFNILVYGCKPAVAIVTKLLKPVKAFLYSIGIRLTLYIDDGRVVAGSAAEAAAKFRVALLTVQLAGWNIQWSKTGAEPTQQLYHLGFVTDTVAMKYFTPVQKLDMLSARIYSLLSDSEGHAPIPCRTLAVVLGSIAAMRRSHGNMMQIMTRAAQHDLGMAVHSTGWNSNVVLSHAARQELAFVRGELYSVNGQYIISVSAAMHVVELAETEKIVRQIQETADCIDNLFVSDASESHAFVYKADGQLCYVRDFEFTTEQKTFSSGHRELLAVKMALLQDPKFFQNLAPAKVYWQTDSVNCQTFLNKGSRRPKIPLDVLRIK